MKETQILRGLHKAKEKCYRTGTRSVRGKAGRDKVPAMLTKGEAVLTPGAADAIGRGNIAAANAAHAPKPVGLHRAMRMPTSRQHFAEGTTFAQDANRMYQGAKNLGTSAINTVKGWMPGGGTPIPTAAPAAAPAPVTTPVDLDVGAPRPTTKVDFGPSGGSEYSAADNAGIARPAAGAAPTPAATPGVGNNWGVKPANPFAGGSTIGNIAGGLSAVTHGLGAAQAFQKGDPYQLAGDTVMAGLNAFPATRTAGMLMDAAGVPVMMAGGEGAAGWLGKGLHKADEVMAGFGNERAKTRLSMATGSDPSRPAPATAPATAPAPAPAAPAVVAPSAAPRILSQAAGTPAARAVGQQLDNPSYVPAVGTGFMRNNRTGATTVFDSRQPAQQTPQPPMSDVEKYTQQARTAMKSGNWEDGIIARRNLSHAYEMEKVDVMRGLERARLMNEIQNQNEKRNETAIRAAQMEDYKDGKLQENGAAGSKALRTINAALAATAGEHGHASIRSLPAPYIHQLLAQYELHKTNEPTAIQNIVGWVQGNKPAYNEYNMVEDQATKNNGPLITRGRAGGGHMNSGKSILPWKTDQSGPMDETARQQTMFERARANNEHLLTGK